MRIDCNNGCDQAKTSKLMQVNCYDCGNGTPKPVTVQTGNAASAKTEPVTASETPSAVGQA